MFSEGPECVRHHLDALQLFILLFPGGNNGERHGSCPPLAEQSNSVNIWFSYLQGRGAVFSLLCVF